MESLETNEGENPFVSFDNQILDVLVGLIPVYFACTKKTMCVN